MRVHLGVLSQSQRSEIESWTPPPVAGPPFDRPHETGRSLPITGSSWQSCGTVVCENEKFIPKQVTCNWFDETTTPSWSLLSPFTWKFLEGPITLSVCGDYIDSLHDIFSVLGTLPCEVSRTGPFRRISFTVNFTVSGVSSLPLRSRVVSFVDHRSGLPRTLLTSILRPHCYSVLQPLSLLLPHRSTLPGPRGSFSQQN